MSSIYLDLLIKAKQGYKYKIDLKNKNLTIGKQEVIKDGVIVGNYETLIESDDLKSFDYEMQLDKDAWNIVEHLYDVYLTSVPKEDKRKSYFEAHPLDLLTDGDLAFNVDRTFGQAMLEGYILLASIQEWLEWENDKHWFWQSEKFPKLVVLRNWIR